MNEIEKTNGDRITPVIEGARKSLEALAQYVREHPDEAAVAIAPVFLMTLATARHDLSIFERIVTWEIGYWCGVMLAKEYRDWKAKPARPLPKLRRVI